MGQEGSEAMTPRQRQLFARLLQSYHQVEIQTMQKMIEEHLKASQPDLLVPDRFEKNSQGLYTPPAGADVGDPADVFPAFSYNFKYVIPAPPVATGVIRRRIIDDLLEPPEAEFEVNLTEALVGWKAWSVDKTGIWSVQQAGHRWPPDQPFAATCRAEGPSAWNPAMWNMPACSTPVNREHTCGIYAGTREEATRYAEDAEDILGEVYGWGRYVRGDSGWRAQFAYPKCFYLRESQAGLLGFLRPYHVPIFVDQPMLVYSPEEDGYEHRSDETDGDRGAPEAAAAPEEADPDDEAFT